MSALRGATAPQWAGTAIMSPDTAISATLVTVHSEARDTLRKPCNWLHHRQKHSKRINMFPILSLYKGHGTPI